MLGIQRNLNGKWNIRKKGNVYQFHIGGNIQVFKMFKYLYCNANSNIYLDRKYNKFIDFYSKYNES